MFVFHFYKVEEKYSKEKRIKARHVIQKQKYYAWSSFFQKINLQLQGQMGGLVNLPQTSQWVTGIKPV